MSLKRPLLTIGDTLGVIGLSSPCEPSRFTTGLKFLESLGFKTKVALSPTKAYGTTEFLFSTDTPKNRAKGLEALFKDKEVKAIISARGAYGAMEVLSFFDFEVAKKNPKPFIGFSDTTAVLVALRQRSNCVTVHGPSIESFAGALENEQRKESALALKNFLIDKNFNPFAQWKLDRAFGKGTMKGEILGGNLSLLGALCGTPWQPKLKDKILFLEEIGERPYRMHRMLLQLKQSGALDALEGVILGSFKDCEHDKGNGPSTQDVLRDIFAPFRIPVLSGVPAGHEAFNLPVPFGIEAEF